MQTIRQRSFVFKNLIIPIRHSQTPIRKKDLELWAYDPYFAAQSALLHLNKHFILPVKSQT
jgi:hypothetical protein